VTVIALANQKGGTAKTTSTLNLGVALAEIGKSVLVVDFDPQASLTVCIGKKAEDLELTIYDVMRADLRDEDSPTLQDVIIPTELGIDLVPANIALSQAEMDLVGAMGGELVLRDILVPVRQRYDFILIDCLPSLGLMTVNALIAADQVIIPVAADYLAMKGLQLILRTIYKVKRKFNPQLEITGILLTRIEAQTRHSRSVVENIRRFFVDKVYVFEAEIDKTVKVQESAVAHESMLTYASSHPVAQAYRQLAQEVVDQKVVTYG
jgi:chromosome partitioning protein